MFSNLYDGPGKDPKRPKFICGGLPQAIIYVGNIAAVAAYFAGPVNDIIERINELRHYSRSENVAIPHRPSDWR